MTGFSFLGELKLYIRLGTQSSCEQRSKKKPSLKFHYRNSLLEKTPFRFMYFPVKRKSAYSAFYSNSFLTPPSVLHVHSSHSTPFLSNFQQFLPTLAHAHSHSPHRIPLCPCPSQALTFTTHSNLCSSLTLSFSLHTFFFPSFHLSSHSNSPSNSGAYLALQNSKPLFHTLLKEKQRP